MTEETDIVATTLPFLRARPVGARARRARGGRLRVAVADPGRDDPAAARRSRRGRPGADRHRQDRRVRAADPVALDSTSAQPQALVLAPTRELAIQVAEAFQRYAAHLPGFHVLPIYGGQSYGPQLGGLQARRARRRRHAGPRDRPPRARHARPVGSCAASCSTRPTRCCAWASSTTSRRSCRQTPATRQIALFSATMPRADPAHRADATCAIRPRSRSRRRPRTAANMRQRYWLVSGAAQARRADAHPRGRAVRRDDRVRAHQAARPRSWPSGSRRAASRPRRSTATSQQQQRERTIAAAARTASSTSSSRPTSPRAGSTSSASAT